MQTALTTFFAAQMVLGFLIDSNDGDVPWGSYAHLCELEGVVERLGEVLS